MWIHACRWWNSHTEKCLEVQESYKRNHHPKNLKGYLNSWGTYYKWIIIGVLFASVSGISPWQIQLKRLKQFQIWLTTTIRLIFFFHFPSSIRNLTFNMNLDIVNERLIRNRISGPQIKKWTQNTFVSSIVVSVLIDNFRSFTTNPNVHRTHVWDHTATK